jgi:peptide/nickel transport system substrate-binding protein
LLYAPEYKDVAFADRGTAEDVFESVTAQDPQTVVIKLRHVFVEWPSYFGIVEILPKHVLGSLSSNAFNTSAFNSAPSVTSGPFKFVKWDKGSQVTLARNDNYYLGAPLLDGFIARTISGDAASSLLTGEIDFSNVIVPADVDRLKRGNVNVLMPEGRVLYMCPNLDPSKHGYKLFGDKNVRQALMYALDRKGIVSGGFLGLGEVSDSPFDHSMWAYDPQVQPKYTYDKAKAESMLDAAGWSKNANGIREKNGVQMVFECPVRNDLQQWVTMAEIVQAQWGQIGVQMTIRQTTLAAWADILTNSRNFDMTISSITWGGGADPAQLSQFFGSIGAAPGGFNGGDYLNNQMDQLLAKANSTSDRAAQKATYTQVQNLFMDELPGIVIVAAPNLWGLTNRVQDLQIGGWTEFVNWYWINKVWVTSGQ